MLALGVFRRYLLAATLGGVGLWVFQTAVYWHALQVTGSSTSVGLLAALIQVPELALVLFVGGVADRAGSRGLMLLAQFLPALAAAVSACVAAFMAFDYVGALAATGALGLAYALWVVPSQAYLAAVIPRAFLPAAFGVSIVQYAAGRILGGVFGGSAVQVGGLPLAFTVASACFAIGCFLTAVLPAAGPTRPRESAHQGATRPVFDSPPIRAPLAIVAIGSLLTYAYLPLMPAVSGELRAGPAGVGLLTAASGLGLLAGGMTAGLVAARLGLGWALLSSAFLAAAATVALAAAGTLPVAGALVFLGAAAGAQRNASAQCLVEGYGGAAHRGRYLGALEFVSVLMYVVGAIIAGLAADKIGVRLTLVAFGLIAGLLLIAVGRRALVTMNEG